MYQNTIKDQIVFQGVGLHSGTPVRMVLKPTLPGAGVVFVRTDLADAPSVAANFKNVIDTRMATVIGQGEAKVSTIEHLMSALQMMGVDNVIVEINGPEVPVMDGSAAVFCESIKSIGIQSQFRVRPVIEVLKKIEIKSDEKWAAIEPSQQLEVIGSIDFEHPYIGFQEFHYIQGETSYRDICSARTFGFYRELEYLKSKGLARGASMHNVVALTPVDIMNPEGLRYHDEFIRHKVLDALGDIKLAGIGLLGKIRLHRAGHDVHHQLLLSVFKDKENYRIIDSNNQVDGITQELLVSLSRLAV